MPDDARKAGSRQRGKLLIRDVCSVGIRWWCQSFAAIRRFDSDALHTGELGARINLDEPLPTDITVAAFLADLNDIQADLVADRGFPFSRIIGNPKRFNRSEL